MPKSVLSDAKAGLVDLMKRRGEISVEQGANALQLAKTTIRQHLSNLQDQGFVETRNKRHGRGRPRKMYRLTDKAGVFFPSREAELLQHLLEFLRDTGREDVIDEFLSRETQRIAAEIREELGPSDSFDLSQVQQALAERGFLPRCRREGDDVVVELCNCPFAAAVDVTQEVCHKEKSILESLLDGPVEREAFMPDGDPCCRYRAHSEASGEDSN